MVAKNQQNSNQEAAQILLGSKNIIITTHMNPDGDAIGSALSIYHFAKDAGCNPKVIINDEVPYNFSFLSDADKVITYDESKHYDEILKAEAIFVVDLNDPSRLKALEKPILESSAKKIVIDHHIEPKEFADIYIVDTEASSAGELIYKFLIQIENVKINSYVAESLYTAIMTDSGNFRFPRTDAELHRIVADLLELGADPVKIYNEVYARVPYRKLQLLGYAYSNMNLYFNGNLCMMYLTADDIKKAEASENDVEDFVETLLNIEGVKVGIMMTEAIDRSVVRISFRSKGDISVRDMALKFDGGGHFHAAGARVYNSDLQTVRHRLLEEASQQFV